MGQTHPNFHPRDNVHCEPTSPGRGLYYEPEFQGNFGLTIFFFFYCYQPIHFLLGKLAAPMTWSRAGNVPEKRLKCIEHEYWSIHWKMTLTFSQNPPVTFCIGYQLHPRDWAKH